MQRCSVAAVAALHPSPMGSPWPQPTCASLCSSVAPPTSSPSQSCVGPVWRPRRARAPSIVHGARRRPLPQLKEGRPRSAGFCYRAAVLRPPKIPLARPSRRSPSVCGPACATDASERCRPCRLGLPSHDRDAKRRGNLQKPAAATHSSRCSHGPRLASCRRRTPTLDGGASSTAGPRLAQPLTLQQIQPVGRACGAAPWRRVRPAPGRHKRHKALVRPVRRRGRRPLPQAASPPLAIPQPAQAVDEGGQGRGREGEEPLYWMEPSLGPHRGVASGATSGDNADDSAGYSLERASSASAALHEAKGEPLVGRPGSTSAPRSPGDPALPAQVSIHRVQSGLELLPLSKLAAPRQEPDAALDRLRLQHQMQRQLRLELQLQQRQLQQRSVALMPREGRHSGLDLVALSSLHAGQPPQAPSPAPVRLHPLVRAAPKPEPPDSPSQAEDLVPERLPGPVRVTVAVRQPTGGYLPGPMEGLFRPDRYLSRGECIEYQGKPARRSVPRMFADSRREWLGAVFVGTLGGGAGSAAGWLARSRRAWVRLEAPLSSPSPPCSLCGDCRQPH